MREDFNIHSGAFSARASERKRWLSGQELRIDSLYDLALGPSFNRDYRASGCRSAIDPGKEGLACFSAFIQDDGFDNRISLGRAALLSPGTLFYALHHERFHAVQHHKVPVLHAHSANRTDVVLCPSSQLWMDELMERAAYANGLRAVFRLAARRPELADDLAAAAPVTYYEAVRCASKDASLIRSHGRLGGVAEIMSDAFKDDYNAKELAYQIDLLLAKPDLAHRQFVRMEEEDVLALGAACGVNPFSNDGASVLPAYRKPFGLSDRNADEVKTLEDLLELDVPRLPTLREGLRGLGRTPESFLAESLSATKAVKARRSILNALQRLKI